MRRGGVIDFQLLDMFLFFNACLLFMCYDFTSTYNVNTKNECNRKRLTYRLTINHYNQILISNVTENNY